MPYQRILARPIRGGGTALMLTFAAMSLCGCGETATKPPEKTPMAAEAITAERRAVPDLRQYPGTTQAVRRVMIVARVTGYLDARHFKEGTMVSEGDPLFTIEQAPFEAAVTSAQGHFNDAVAQATYARIEFERNQPLGESGAISGSEWDQIVAAVAEAEGLLEAAAGALDVAQINLSYTTVKAPFSGRIGQRFVDVGNLVGPESNKNLAELVTVDPMRIIFDPPATESAAFLAAWQKGSIPITLTVAHATGSSSTHDGTLEGEVDLVNNTVDPSTSTFVVRAEFPNQTGRILPGTYALVVVRLGTLPNQVVVPDEAIFRDTQYNFVWSIKDAKAHRNNVTVGVLWNGLRVVEGIDPGTVVVISGDPTRLKEGVEVHASVDTLSGWEKAKAKAKAKTKTEAKTEQKTGLVTGAAS